MTEADDVLGAIDQLATDPQIDQVLTGVRGVLGPDLVGAYLHGSAALGGLHPRSDIDLFVVSTRRTTLEEKRCLVEHLLAVSGGGPRPIELTIVVESEIRPWRYTPTMDFQYGEWLRGAFESGDLEPWQTTTNPDLASLITMVLLGNRPLFGPPPAEILDAVPRSAHVEAMVAGIEPLLDDLASDTRNVLLTLARIWSSVDTGKVRSKDEAAAWALARLPEEHRAVLARARAIYLGEQEERWDDLRPNARAHADHVVGEIERLSQRRRVTSE